MEESEEANERNKLRRALLASEETLYQFALRGLLINCLAEIDFMFSVTYAAYYAIPSADFNEFDQKVMAKINLIDRIENGTPMFAAIADPDLGPFDSLIPDLRLANTNRNKAAHALWRPNIGAYRHPSMIGSQEALNFIGRMVRRNRHDRDPITTETLEGWCAQASLAARDMALLSLGVREVRLSEDEQNRYQRFD